MELPLVSVLMTAYNREKYISEAIDSVLQSTYSNFELIIVDDCSSDNTVSIAKRYVIADNRVKLYINEKNLGDYGNRNKASTYASGEYLMYVDSDDKIYPRGIELCLKLMQQYPNSNFGIRNFSKFTELEMSSEKIINAHFFKEPILTIGPGGTILKRDYFERINQYPTKYGPANDMYFNLKAACNTSVVLIPFEYVFYREHEGQEKNNYFSYLYNNYLFLMDALNELPLPLTAEEKKWLMLKNKRRFLVNISSFFFKTFKLSKTILLIKKTNFRFKDFWLAIFH